MLATLSQQTYTEEQQIIHKFLQGLFDQTPYPGPRDQTIQCIQSAESEWVVAILSQSFDSICNLSVSNIEKIINLIKDFVKALDNGLDGGGFKCFVGQYDVVGLIITYGPPFDTKTLIQHTLWHIPKIQEYVCIMDKAFNKDKNYYHAGVAISQLVRFLIDGQNQEQKQFSIVQTMDDQCKNILQVDTFMIQLQNNICLFSVDDFIFDKSNPKFLNQIKGFEILKCIKQMLTSQNLVQGIDEQVLRLLKQYQSEYCDLDNN